MRLYARTHSERTEKGQGAHKHLTTVFTADTVDGREEIGQVHMRVQDDEIIIASNIPQHSTRRIRATCECTEHTVVQ